MDWRVIHISLKEAKKSLISLYVVGVIGMLLPWTFPIFKVLIPYFLLLCFFILALFHKYRLDAQTFIYFLFVCIAGYVAEVYGVATGQLFGHYTYGHNLGFTLFNTPLLIGINWLFLVYTSAALTEKRKIPVVLKVLIPSLAMVLYDLVTEQMAPIMGMWSFNDSTIPLQNYLAWFGLAVFFHTMLQLMRIRVNNPLSIILLGLQFLFFVILLLFLPK